MSGGLGEEGVRGGQTGSGRAVGVVEGVAVNGRKRSCCCFLVVRIVQWKRTVSQRVLGDPLQKS